MLQSVATGTPITTCIHWASEPEGCYIIARFDGSCKRPKGHEQACGAGVVISLAKDGRETIELMRIIVPLPTAGSAAQAEAHASVVAIAVALHLRKQYAQHSPGILIQGDNLAVIN